MLKAVRNPWSLGGPYTSCLSKLTPICLTFGKKSNIIKSVNRLHRIAVHLRPADMISKNRYCLNTCSPQHTAKQMQQRQLHSGLWWRDEHMDDLYTVLIRLGEIMWDQFFLSYASECSAVGMWGSKRQTYSFHHALSLFPFLFPFPFNHLFNDARHLCASCQEICLSPFVICYF